MANPAIMRVLNDMRAKRKQQLKELAEGSLYEFFKQSWPYFDSVDFMGNWHLEVVCEHLEAVNRGEIKRLIVNVPPRTAKTALIGVAWPLWTWIQDERSDTIGPGAQFLFASYSYDLSVKSAEKSRRLLFSKWFQENWGDKFSILADSNRKDDFVNDYNGGRLSTSVGGTLTGLGGSIIVCLPYEEMIYTDQGFMEIGKVVEQRISCKVASWNGSSVVWRRILKYERNPGRPTVLVKHGSGQFRCTTDHPVYVEGRGFVPATNVRPGDRLKALSLPVVRCGHDRERPREQAGMLQPALPDEVKDVQGGLKWPALLRSLWRLDISRAVPLEAIRERPVLQQAMPRQGLFGREEPRLGWRRYYALLQKMFGTVYPPQIPSREIEVLQYFMLLSGCMGQEWTLARKALRAMREAVQAAYGQEQILLYGVQRHSPCTSHDRGGEWQIRSRRGGAPLSTRMDKDIQAEDKGQGRQCMPYVRHDAGEKRSSSLRSSYRLQQGELGPQEPDNALPILSRADARTASRALEVEASIVESVEDGGYEPVTYNVNVDIDHNYFAGGILVHNCDDPNSAQDAESKAVRETTNLWWDEALSTRLNNPKTGAFVVVQQRLHEEDITGHILASTADDWTHLMLPMRFDAGRACPADIRTEDGELLWPERFGEKEVGELEKRLGPTATSGQLQQSPSPRGGGIIKTEWWQDWPSKQTPPLDYIVASLDTAMTEKEESDYSALTVWGSFQDSGAIVGDEFGGYDFVASNEPRDRSLFGQESRERMSVVSASLPKILLLNAWRERLGLPELVEKVIFTCIRYRVDVLIIENKAHGFAVIQTIREILARKPFGVVMYEPRQYGDKSARLYSIQHLFSEGLIYAPLEKAWADMVIQEVANFPRAKNDDLVDCCSMALQHLRQRGFAPRREDAVSGVTDRLRHRGTAKPLYNT